MHARDLIVFGEDWGEHPSSTQHLIRQYLGKRKVIWVNSLGLRMPRLDLADASRAMRKLRDLARRSLQAPTELPKRRGPHPDSIIAPAAIPMPGSATAGKITRALVSRQVAAAMETLDIRKPILWTSLPTAEPLLGAFDEHAVVYYAGDDFSALEGVDHAPVVELETRLAARARIILAASPEIATRFPAGKTLVVPHGVDIGLFATPCPKPFDLPKTGPIVGFYGSVSGWIDTGLIARAATMMPQAQFVMIGPVNADIRHLALYPNVTFLGPKAHHDLPAYVQHFDVAMLPFLDTPQIRACNPLKLREYLASGTPIATTDFPALDPYRSLVHVGNDTRGFVHAIQDALKDKRGNLRQRAVTNETWARRAEDVAAVIDLL